MRPTIRIALTVATAFVALRGAQAAATRTLNVPADYPTIQQAVDAARTGDRIAVGAGVYTGGVVLSNLVGVTLSGDPRAEIHTGGVSPTILVKDCDGIVVEGFEIVSGMDAVSLQDSANVTLRDVVVASAGRDGVRTNEVDGVEITNVTVSAAAGSGIRIASVSGGVGCKISGCTVDSTGSYGIFVHMQHDGLPIEIAGNTVSHSGSDGIRLECGFGQLVTGNVVNDAHGDGISVYRGAGTCTIAGNSVAGATNGLRVEGCPGLVIRENELTDLAYDGVSVISCSGACRIDDNHVLRAGVHGLGLTGVFSVKLNDNSIGETGSNGIDVRGTSGVEILSNELSQMGGAGIVVQECKGVCDVMENGVWGADGHGMYLDIGSRVRVQSNTVATAGGDAVRIVHFGSTFDASDNFLSDPVGTGLSIAGQGYATASRNHVSGAGGDGVAATGGNMVFDATDNVVMDVGGAGIRGDVLWQATATDNVIETTRGDGIAMAGTPADVRSNEVRDAAGAGIRISDADGAILASENEEPVQAVGENRVERSGIAGIVVSSVDRVPVESNQVIDSRGDGIVVDARGTIVAVNFVANAAHDGVCLMPQTGNSRVRIADNQVTSPGADGIDLGGARGARVTDNMVQRAGDCGFRLDAGASSNVLKGNSADGCAVWDLYESDEAGKNQFAKSNRFTKKHTRHARHGN